MEQSLDYFLLIDSNSAALRSKMQVLGLEREGKSLKSLTPNWKAIAALASSEKCVGVIVTLTERSYNEIARVFKYRYLIEDSVVRELFEAIGKKPHLVLAHEALVGGGGLYGDDVDLPIDNSEDEEGMPSWYMPPRDYFGDIDEEVRLKAHERLGSWGIEVLAYKRNVEAEQLASHFVEDASSNLILRVYIPHGRLYQQETEQLLGVFHKWLRTIKKINVRKDGYSSGKGSVIEFRAASSTEVELFQAEIPQFTKFISTLGNMQAAQEMLSEYGIESLEASRLVSEFSTDFRRMDRDARRRREEAGMQLRYQLEEELGDELPETDSQTLVEIVNRVIPPMINVLSGQQIAQSDSPMIVNNIGNQQIIHRAEGIVTQNLNGTAVLSEGAIAFELIISEHASGITRNELIQALRELDDESAPSADRVKAKGKLRTFLAAVAGKVGNVAVQMGQKYLEGQLGI